MGKGNRNSQKRLENQLANEEKLLAKERAQKNKKKSDKIIAAACIVFALIIVAVLVLNVLSETGVFVRAKDAVSQGEVVVDAAMMTFFINDHITSWYNNYYAYMMYGMISLNMSKDFKDQKLTSNDAYYMGDSKLAGTTWYDYFVNTVVESVEMYVTYANAANAAGIKLSEDDKKEIDETIKELKDSLKEYKMTFADQYGKGVTENDIRKCYELIYLASAFGESKQESIESMLSTEAGEEKILNYRDENKGMFYSAKYLSYTIDVSEKTLKTQEKYDAAVKDAKLAAEKIAAAKTPADFVALVEEYKKSPSKFVQDENSTETGTDTEVDSATATEKETNTEKETTDPMEKYEETLYYQTGDKLGDWIFDETEPAETNDTLIIEETGTEVVTEKSTTKSTETATEKTTETSTEKSTETGADNGKITYETYKVTVYMLVTLPDLDRSNTHNMAYVISDNKVAAEAFLAEFTASGTKNRDIFEELAKKQYDKLFEGHDHDDHEEGEKDPVFSYAKADQAKEKYFADEYAALNKWLDEGARKNGDYTTKLIEITIENSDNTKTTYYAALYFESQDDPAWHVDAFAGATQKEIDDWYKAELGKKLIKYNWDAIGDIPLIRYAG